MAVSSNWSQQGSNYGIIKGRVTSVGFEMDGDDYEGSQGKDAVRTVMIPTPTLVPAGTPPAPLQPRDRGNVGIGIISSESSNISPVLGLPPPPIDDEEIGTGDW